MFNLIRLHTGLVSLLTSWVWFFSVGLDVEAEDKFRLSVNEFEGKRYIALQWVEYERLPSSFARQTPNEEAEFKRAWADAGNAATKVAAEWNQAFEDDPLLKKASECLDRYHDLEWQYNTLRTGLRQRYGLDGFRKMERQSSRWNVTNGNPWLNLQDTELVRLVLWWAESVHSESDVPKNKEPAVPYAWLTQPDDWFSQWTETFLSLSAADLNSEETLTKKRAIELFCNGVERKRKQVSKQHDDLTAKLDLPIALFRYLEIRQEAEAMHQFGFGYLQIELPKHDEITKAEAKFEVAMKKVCSIRPYALIALGSVHLEAMHEEVKKVETQQAKLQAIFSDKSRNSDTTLK